MDRGHTKRITKANRTRLSKPLAKNLRARETRKRRSATRRIKELEKERNEAAMIAHMVAQAAQQIGVAPVPAPDPVGGAGAAAAAAPDPLGAQVNLEQAVLIMNQVLNEAENPVPAIVEVQQQAAAVRERGRGCSFRITLKDVFFILMTILNAYALKYPMIAPPREATYFDSAAGYFGIAGMVGGLLSLDTAGTYTACGIGLQLVGGLTRGVASVANVYPMTRNNMAREALKFAEYMPGPASKALSYGKYGGLATLTGKTLYKHAGTGAPKLRGGTPSIYPAPETPFLKELLAPFSNAAVNIATKAVNPHKISESTVLNTGIGVVASSLLL